MNKYIKSKESQNKTSSNMLTPGTILKHYREKRGYSIEEVSQSTKIPLEQIKKIENDEFGDKEKHVFYRGFIQNYADYLNIDAQKVLAIYRRTTATQDEEKIPAVKKENEKKPKERIEKKFKQFQITPQLVGLAIIFCLVFVVIGYIFIQLRKFQEPPNLTLTSPEIDAILYESALEIEGETDPGTVIEINGEILEEGLSEDGTFNTEITLSEGTNIVVIKAYRSNKEDKSTQITRTVTYVIEREEPEEEELVEEEIVSEHTVQIEIVGQDTWIQLIIDKVQKIAYPIKPGKTSIYKFENEFSLTTGKPRSTKVYVDEKEIELTPNPQSGIAKVTCNVSGSEVVCD